MSSVCSGTDLLSHGRKSRFAQLLRRLYPESV
jgi:hypothetical protein